MVARKRLCLVMVSSVTADGQAHRCTYYVNQITKKDDGFPSSFFNNHNLAIMPLRLAQ